MFKGSLETKLTRLQQFVFFNCRSRNQFLGCVLFLKRYIDFSLFLVLTCPSELLKHLIAQKDELAEEVDTLREMLRVS